MKKYIAILLLTILLSACAAPQTTNATSQKLNWSAPNKYSKLQLIDPSEVKSKPIIQFEPNTPPQIADKQEQDPIPNINPPTQLACKKCNSNDSLEAASGRYGYYVKCNVCDTNTTMKKKL